MGLRDIGERLPPGFRFYPSDEELICHYLYKKIANEEEEEEALRATLVEIDLHVCEPWQIPDVAKLNSNEWYFFSFRDRKYATGFRTNRATTTGYWKATGKDRVVMDPRTRNVVGMRKTLVFYKNRAPNGIKTRWIMHEFRIENPYVPPKEDWVLCRVFHKSREEPKSPINTLHDSTCFSPSPLCNALCQYDENISSLPHNLTHHQEHGHTLNTSLGLSAIEAGPVFLSHEMNDKSPLSSLSNYGYQINKALDHHNTTKREDELYYGFLFDIEGPNNEVLGILDDMNFNRDDGSVFV